MLREKANEAIIEVAKLNNEVAKLQNKAYNEAVKAYKCFKHCASQGRFGYNHDCDCCERFVKEAECLIEKSNEVLKKANSEIEEAIKLSHCASELQKKEFDTWIKAICMINEAFNKNAKALPRAAISPATRERTSMATGLSRPGPSWAPTKRPPPRSEAATSSTTRPRTTGSPEPLGPGC